MKSGVVMLVNEFPPLPVGGAELQAERLSAHLAKRGWPVWVLTRRAPGLPASESRLGFQIVRPPALGLGKLQTISFILGTLAELWRLRKKYSILHAHLAFGPALAGVLAARLLGKHMVMKLGNSGEFGDICVSQKTWRGRLRLLVFRRWAELVIVLDEAMQTEVLSAGFDPQRVRRMNNGINARAFASSPSSPSRLEAQSALGLARKVVVLSMGRLAAQKSLSVLFRSFAGALPDCPNLHLLVVGDGPERASLEELAQSLNIVEHVTFTGNQVDVLPYLSAADLFVLPSASEGISNALLEAMSAGVACMATPVGGNSEVLENGRCGLLLPVGDIPAWNKALVELGQSARARDRLGKAAQERIRSEYDFDVVGARYESLYAELLGNKQTAVKVLVEVKR